MRFLAVTLTAFLLITGCGPSKKVEKGSDEKIVLETSTANKGIPTRPATVVPPEAAGKNKTTSPGK